MKFTLEVFISHGDKNVGLAELAKDKASCKAVFSKPEEVEGALIPYTNGKAGMEVFCDPLFALLEQWILKLPWCLGGDTETVFLKNSEHAFGFEPMSESLQLSFYVGQGNEVDEYILEPVPIMLDSFCDASIAAVKKVLAVVQDTAPEAMTSPDVKTLQDATKEAERALREYRHSR
ncbi:MAG: hypothetical protein IT381_26315 [Deltaproteobacteria bacterium]|nr:hypothetical protein [Deltaproteobacteria bacterium]